MKNFWCNLKKIGTIFLADILDKARVAELVDALVLGTSTIGVGVRVSPLVKEDFVMNIRNYFILICFILVSCSSQINNKTLIYNDKYVCISEEKESCSNTMFEKCGKSYDLIKEEYYTYFFKPNRYIITFKCN